MKEIFRIATLFTNAQFVISKNWIVEPERVEGINGVLVHKIKDFDAYSLAVTWIKENHHPAFTYEIHKVWVAS